MLSIERITPCLWFDDQAQAAAEFSTSAFPNSRIVSVARYGEAGREVHGKPPGSVMVVAFKLDGQTFTALNGGPVFTFNEAISFQVGCERQDEIDDYWDKLSAGGDPGAQQCGWLKDKYGLSWQIVPTVLPKRPIYYARRPARGCAQRRSRCGSRDARRSGGGKTRKLEGYARSRERGNAHTSCPSRPPFVSFLCPQTTFFRSTRALAARPR